MSEAVRVIVRCRPLNEREKRLKCDVAIDVDESRNQVVLKTDPTSKTTLNKEPKCFTFDGAYGVNSKTSNIYAESAASLVESVIDGFNGTVFAYGQTGCGKSYTMEGPDIEKSLTGDTGMPDNAGIIPRAYADIFDSVALSNAENKDKRFLIHASYLEIYNENVRDLLTKNESNITSHLELKEHPERGVYVKNLSMHQITNAVQAQKLMTRGLSNRVTGQTLMNQDSSRSHAIFTLYIETEENGNIRAGKMHLVDLAGSERQSKTMATGIRLKEAAKINLSLSALGNVISSLVDGKAKHIPYRDSKLTRILQDSLGGNTKTLMIACFSPADNNYEETLSTLRYANRAKKIKNAPRINEDPKDALLRQYQEEILELKKLLQNQLGPDGLASLISGQRMGNQPILATDQSNLQPRAIETPAPESERSESQEIAKYKQKIAKLKEQMKQEVERRIEAEKIIILFKKRRDASNDKLSTAEKEVIEQITAHENKIANSSSRKSIDLTGNITQAETIAFNLDGENANHMSMDYDVTYDVNALGNLMNAQKEKLNLANFHPQIEVANTDNLTQITEAEIPDDCDLHKTEDPGTTINPQAASLTHEKNLKRLLELQRGMTRAVAPISTEALANIKRKRAEIKSKQNAAERRRELAKKAVEAKDDEEMFQALFENVHNDVRLNAKKFDKAKEIIKNLKVEKNELLEEFNIERLNYQEELKSNKKSADLLAAIIDKMQSLVKRDCNYASVDRIKKQAKWDDERQEWLLPQVSMNRDLPFVGQSDREATQVLSKNGSSGSRFSSRQLALMGGGGGFNSNHSSLEDYNSHNSTTTTRSMQPEEFEETFRTLSRKGIRSNNNLSQNTSNKPSGKLRPLALNAGNLRRNKNNSYMLDEDNDF